MVVHKRKAYGQATPDEPLRRAPEWTTQWKIYLSCRRGFMMEYLSWNSSIALNAIKKNLWNGILTFLYFVCTINIIFQDCLRTRQQISQKRRGERRTSDGTGSLERVRGIIKIGCMNKELFWKVESDLILSFWSSRTNMETKAHKKKSRKRCLAE